jgi:hypothetical protein
LIKCEKFPPPHPLNFASQANTFLLALVQVQQNLSLFTLEKNGKFATSISKKMNRVDILRNSKTKLLYMHQT